MNISSVESAITISPNIQSSYSWNADNTTLTITPNANLFYNTTYNITIGTGAKDIAGNNLENPYSWEFTTLEDPEIIQPPVSEYQWWIGIIIFLVAVIVLLALCLYYRTDK